MSEPTLLEGFNSSLIDSHLADIVGFNRAIRLPPHQRLLAAARGLLRWASQPHPYDIATWSRAYDVPEEDLRQMVTLVREGAEG